MANQSKTPSCQKESIFGTWDFRLTFETPYFQKYIESIDSFNYSQELKLAGERIEEVIKEKGEILDEHREWLMENYSNIAYEEHEIIQLLYRSFVVSAFIFIEQNLIDYCGHLKRGHHQTFTYLDMRGDGVGRPLRYIKTVLGIEFPKNKGTRDLLNAARAIRNIIVHNDARPTDDELKHIKRILHLHPALLAEDGRSLNINRNYAESLIKLNLDLTKELKSACVDLENRSKTE